MLEHLDVTFNRLDTIEKLEHSNLRTLLISVNRLKELREAEWRLPRLQHLEVINNQLVGVDMRVFNGIKVLHLGKGVC
jgi:Leucine-rich repeat (LRR) protein